MHVTRVALGIAAVALAACNPPRGEDKTRLVTHEPAASASVTPAAPDPTMLKLARAAKDAAWNLASRCRLSTDRHYDEKEQKTYVSVYDSCEWRPEDVTAMSGAAKALLTANALPRSGHGASFVEHVRLFSEWVAGAPAAGGIGPAPRYRGALVNYQNVARAWNAWQPAEPVLVQPALKFPDDVDAGPKDAIVTWQRCPEGPCLSFPGVRY